MSEKQFVARNGIVAKANSTISGSLLVTGTITGSFSGSGTVESASFASTASYVNPLVQDILITGSTFISSSNATQLQVGNNSMVVLDNGRVGIGITTPGELLHLSSTNPSLRFDDTNSGLHYIVKQDGDTFSFNTNNPNQFSAYLFDSRVGIGTTSRPTAQLQVKGSGTTSATTAFRIENANASGSMVVLDNGFVGIGKNTPISTLHLGNDTSGFLGDFTTPVITFNTLNNGIYLDSNRINFKSGGGFSFGTDSNGLLGNGFRINSDLFNDLTTPIFVPLRLLNGLNSGYGGNNAGHLSLITNNTPRIYVDFSGSVGIGTTSPTEKLEVTGNIKLSSVGTGNSASSYGLLFYGTTSAGTQTDQAKIQSSPWSTNTNGGNLQFYTSNASNVITERVRINGDGNVGIGTTSPNSYAGYTTLTLDHPTSGGIIDLEKAGTRIGSLNVNDGNFNIVNPIASNMLLFTSFVERLRITSTGNVGIGTTSPTAKLQVKGSGTTSATTAFRVENANASGSMVVLDDGTTRIGSTWPITITPSNSAVISTPGAALTIGSGTSTAQFVDGSIFLLKSNNNEVLRGFPSSLNCISIGGGFNPTETLEIGGAKGTLKVNSHSYLMGNVGIGTTSPSYTLDVSGSGNFTDGLTVTGSFITSTLTASSAVINGDVTIHGTASVDVLITNYESSSIIYSSGSTKFGDTLDDTHQFTGSVSTLGENFNINLTSSSDVFLDVTNTYVSANDREGSTGIQFNYGPNQIPAARIIAEKVDDFTDSGFNANSSFTFQNVYNGTYRTWMSTNTNGHVTLTPRANNNPGLTINREFSSHPMLLLRSGDDAFNNYVGLNISSSNQAYINFDNTGEFFIGSANAYLNPLTRHLRIRPGTSTVTTIVGKGTTSSTTAFRVENTNASASMVILDDGNVGIGTTSPATPLDVTGAGRFSGHVRSDFLNTYDNSKSIIGAPSNYVSIYNGSGAEAVRINSTGNVGIGTTTPSYTLDVSGSGNFTDGLTVTGSFITSTLTASSAVINGDVTIHGTASVDVLITNYESSSIIYSSGSTKFGDTLDDTHQFTGSMYVTGSGTFTGNVGIGTASPSEKLQVKDGNILIENNGVVGQDANLTLKAHGSGESRITFRDQDGISGSLEYIHNGSSDRFRFGVSGSAEALTIAKDGNVGIGTTSPATPLDVTGAGRFTDTLYANGVEYTGGNIGQARTVLFTNNVLYTRGGSAGHFLQNADGSEGMLLANDHIRLETNGIERIRITSAGNVGIGTASPSYKLDVKSAASNSYFTSFTPSAGSGFIRIFQDSNNHLSIYGANASGTTTIVLNTNGVSYIKGGNVIVGGSADNGATFQVAGNVTATSFTGSFSGSVAAPGSTTQIVYNSGGALAADSGLVYSGSNVGIGTTSPGYPLDVVSNSSANALKLRVRSTNDNGNVRFTSYDGSEILGSIYFQRESASTGNLTFYTSLSANNQPRLKITSGGNVGIGTTTPSAKLHVKSTGTTNATTSFKVENANASASLVVTDASLVQIANPSYTTSTAANFEGILLSNTAEIRSNSNDPSRVANFRLYNPNTATGAFELYRTGVITTQLTAGANTSNDYSFVTYGNFGLGTTTPSHGKLVISSNAIRPGSTSLLYVTGSTSETYDLARFVSDNTTRVVISNSGSIGIGTSTPITRLDVAAPGLSDATLINTDPGGIIIHSTSAGDIAALDFGFYDPGSPIRNSLPQGRLAAEYTGLGTKFHFLGTWNFNSGINRQLVSIDEIGQLGVRVQTPTAAAHIKGTGTTSSTTAFLVENANASGSMVVLDNGSVGIGTTSPTEVLEVVGNIRANISNGGGFMLTGASASGLVRAGATGLALRTNTTDRLTVDNSGNVGIGTTTPVSELQVVGTITTTALVETSARRYKEDIKPLEPQLEKVNKLNPVNFTWKENKKEDVGFIAEEMQEIFPELVSESADGQVEGIQYSKLTAVLVKALQEQQKQINDLKEEIFILKNK